ncbi:TonB-dependent receptor [Sphingobium jiangsuense]|uniref:Outer membrane receptor protein involved in Fe transport n=1 Tax=Sphingobium jiangsuense TaxID=870476 RepID=A0A7W6BH06_9SPHN|nr:TonB-dependent receptor [Sphingobium jiangsuense]MBB3926825.1 outer membrane receptor protein involved in Fe transport [Sphingobium jiangsuense]GLS98833.1 TonB-dependent receptor [Sphingobium jiangsuense]
MKRPFDKRLLCAAASAASLSVALAQPAHAQDNQPQPAAEAVTQGGLEDIVVTARKRAESVQNIPVAVTALSEALIQRQDLTSIEKVAARTPNLNVGRSSNGSGAQLTMRGIGSSSTSIGIEQSVAVVVDGVYYGQGRIINEGFFDLARVEILKGPQALFFGKNATAGVISLTTADPGDTPEYKGRVSYEFKSEQAQVELIGSLPLSDTLGVRLAVRGSKMWGGYYRNDSPARNYYTTADFATATQHTALPAADEQPGEKELLGRLTLKWDGGEGITNTLKVSGDYSKTNNSSWNYVMYECANGVSSLNGSIACGNGFTSHQNNFPADIAATFPFAGKNGALYNRYKSWQATNTLVYDLDDLSVTNVTNYNWNNNRWACACDFQSSDVGTFATENSSWHAFSNEFRVLTQFDSPINLMAGVLYQKTKRKFDQFVTFAAVPMAGGIVAGPDNPAAGANRYVASTKASITDGETIAGFGQVTWKVVPTVELAAGVRYTHETKDSFFSQPYVNAAFQGIFVEGRRIEAKQSFNNWSPEVSLTWKPVEDILVYGAYKTAYKSGGFSNGGIDSALSADPLSDLTFDPEKARGFEGGIKTTLADRQLRLNLGVYSYAYKDLQVDFFNSPIFAFQTLTADARTKGVEVEFEFAPHAVPGLNIHGSLNYTRARYTSFPLAPCYAGQTPAQGCNLAFNSAIGAYTRQDLGGKPLSVAPDWTGAFGVSYDTALGNGLKVGVNADVRYSDSYLVSGFGNPYSHQSAYATLDAGIRVGAEDDRWQVALIGKNLTNRQYINGGVDGPSTGSGTGTPTGVHADQLGFGALPRTVMLQLSTQF